MPRTAKPTAPEREKHPKANIGSFGIGRDPLERIGGTPVKEVPARVEVEGTGLLADYRFVWENDKAHDDTPKRKTLRRLLVDDPRGFVKDLKELEKADLLAQAGGGGRGKPGPDDPSGSLELRTSPPAPDLGTDKALTLVDRLLAEIGVKP